MAMIRTKDITDLFRLEKKPHKGLFAIEWVIVAYTMLTLLTVLFISTKLQHPDAMIWGRLRVLACTLALWLVYRLLPCKATRLLRVLVQLMLLGWWYPDTFEINRVFPNLDHVFASAEQSIFGCQPALLFHQTMPQYWFSELMDLGYASYYPLIGLVTLYYFCYRYGEFERASFVILASFFAYYVIFIYLPVTGPQYYYHAVGLEDIAKGIFPNLNDYFSTHSERMVSPGWTDGPFYHLVEQAHDAGERPTAAFPSSHVGITTVLMLLAWHSGNRKLFCLMLPFFLLMCFATVYIMAHYAIDAIAGLFSGVAFYFLFMFLSANMLTSKPRR